MIVIDFTNEHFQGRPKPPERGGKFVQLTSGKQQALALSPIEMHSYHANIVEAFLRSRGEEGQYNYKRDHYFTEDTGWEVVGGGYWKLSEPEGTLRLGGTSMAYGPFSPKGLARLIRDSKVFLNMGLRVIIDK